MVETRAGPLAFVLLKNSCNLRGSHKAMRSDATRFFLCRHLKKSPAKIASDVSVTIDLCVARNNIASHRLASHMCDGLYIVTFGDSKKKSNSLLSQTVLQFHLNALAIDRVSSLISFSSCRFTSKCAIFILAPRVDPTGTISSPTSEKD